MTQIGKFVAVAVLVVVVVVVVVVVMKLPAAGYNGGFVVRGRGVVSCRASGILSLL
jgi:hypothetical protein